MLAKARDDGYAPAALAVRDVNAAAPPRFDFLPQVLRAQGAAASDRSRRYLWITAGVLILVNIAVLVGRDVVEVSRLQDRVDAQTPGLEAVQRLRQRIEREDVTRRDLIARGRQTDPLRVISLLTRALPPTAWVQHLEWNGLRLRIVGSKRDNADLGGILRGTGAFANPRTLVAAPAAGGGLFTPFDVIADARPEVRR